MRHLDALRKASHPVPGSSTMGRNPGVLANHFVGTTSRPPPFSRPSPSVRRGEKPLPLFSLSEEEREKHSFCGGV